MSHSLLRGIVIGLLLACCPWVFAQQQPDYQWRNVAIGAGGFVSAIITSREEPGLIYARTDVGGVYRWDGAEQRWIPLTDWLSDQQVGLLGIESLAIDPQATGRLYMLAGISYFNDGRSAILRSDDYGATFEVIDVSAQFKAHGNGMGRQNGERLQVDPNNGEILYTGTRWNGLWRSEDRGENWTRVDALDVTTTPNENGVNFVVVDPDSMAAGRSQTLIVGVSRFASVGTNLYRSDNGGATFSPISGAPENHMPQRATLSPDGNLYITYGNGAGPHGHWQQPEPINNGAVWRYHLETGVWTDITPQSGRAYGGISVDPGNPQRLVTSTINTWLQQYPGAYGDRIYLSTTGGDSWVDVVARGFTLDNAGVSWINGHAIHWAGSIEFDPAQTNRVWVTSGNGIFVNDNIDSSGTWRFTVDGFEETVPLDLVSIPEGPLVSAIGDYDGFRHTNVDDYAPIHQPQMGTTTGIAVAEQNTDIVVRVGNDMYYSTDMAQSWTKTATLEGNQGRVALSADGSVILHSPNNGTTSYRSTNWGGSWTAITGLTINSAYILADPVNANKFYAYNPGNGQVSVSGDGGMSFSPASSLAAGGSRLIRAAPGREGDIWVALNAGGLARSTDGGANFSSIDTVDSVHAVGFGRTVTGGEYPTVYIWGTVNGVRGLHRSTDTAATWVRINDDEHQYGGPGNGQLVLGDRNRFGVVYMSTAGRGLVYGRSLNEDETGEPDSDDSSGGEGSSSSASSASSSSQSSAPPSGGSRGGGLAGWPLLVLLVMALRRSIRKAALQRCLDNHAERF